MRIKPARTQDRGSEGVVWLAAALMATAAAGIFFLASNPARGSDDDGAWRLAATEADNHIRVSWNPQEKQVKRATAATLEVRDGSRMERYPVNRDILRRGSLDYIHQTGDVLLTLTLLDDGAEGPKTMVRAISALAPDVTVAQLETAQRSRVVEGSQRQKAKAVKKRARARRR